MMSTSPLCSGRTVCRFSPFLAVLPFLLLTACFSGQQEGKTSGDKSAEKAALLDTVKLSQLAVPTNAAYNAVLDGLDRNDLQNINRALHVFSNNKADSLSRDSMLVSFDEFMNVVMQEYYTDQLTGNQKMIDHFENREDRTEAVKVTSLLAMHGINLSFREGDFYLEPDQAFVYDHLKGVLTTSSQCYLQTKTELAKGFTDENNRQLSPPDSLARQIIVWEDFMDKNPGYVLKDEIQAQYIDVMAAYISGLEQCPLFDPSTKMLTPAYQASYLSYIEKYPNRESTKIVKKFYDLLASKGYKYDEGLDSFLSEINLIPSQNQQ